MSNCLFTLKQIELCQSANNSKASVTWHKKQKSSPVRKGEDTIKTFEGESHQGSSPPGDLFGESAD